MQVRELMNQSVVSITPGESASLAARLLARHQLGALPVCGEDRDIVTRCVAAETDPHKVPVREIMSRNCAVISPEEDAAEAARLMGAGQVRRLPVLEDGKVVGMVSLGDLAKCRACDMEAAEALSEISENIHRPPTSGPSD